MVVILLDDDIGGINAVHPFGNFFIILALAGEGVSENCAADIGAGEEADALDYAGADPVGDTFLVNFEVGFVEHKGGVLEAEMASQIAAEVLGGGILDTNTLGIKADDLNILGHHIDDKIGGKPLAAVCCPFDNIAVDKGRYADGTALIVDLGVVLGHFELADILAELTKLAVAKTLGAVLIQHGDLVIADLVDIFNEIALGKLKESGVRACAENGHTDNAADNEDHNKKCADYDGDSAVSFKSAPKLASVGDLVKADADGAEHAVNKSQQKEKAVKALIVKVDCRELEIEVNSSEKKGYYQIDNYTFCSSGFHKVPP